MSELAQPEASQEDKLRSLRIRELEERMIEAVQSLDFRGKEQFDFARAIRVLIDAETNHEHAMQSHTPELVQILDGRYRKSVAALSEHVSRENPHAHAIANYRKTATPTISEEASSQKRRKTIEDLRTEFESITVLGGSKRNAVWLEREALAILELARTNRDFAIQKYNSDVVRGVERLEADIQRLLTVTLAAPPVTAVRQASPTLEATVVAAPAEAHTTGHHVRNYPIARRLEMIRRIRALEQSGALLPDACKEVGITEPTYDRWCKKHDKTEETAEEDLSQPQEIASEGDSTERSEETLSDVQKDRVQSTETTSPAINPETANADDIRQIKTIIGPERMKDSIMKSAVRILRLRMEELLEKTPEHVVPTVSLSPVTESAQAQAEPKEPSEQDQLLFVNTIARGMLGTIPREILECARDAGSVFLKQDLAAFDPATDGDFRNDERKQRLEDAIREAMRKPPRKEDDEE